MHQALFAGQELEECAEFDDADHFGVINLTNLRHGAYFLDPFDGCLDAFLVLRSDVDNAKLAFLFNIDDCVGLGLNLLDDFAALADDSSDEVFGYLYLDDAGYEGLVVLSRLGDGFLYVVEDVETALTSLLKCFSQNVIAQAVDLDIHLAGGDTVAGTAHLEVHIAQVVLVTENVAQHGPFVAFADKSHSDAGHRLANLHAGVHKCQASGADGCHR